MDTHKKISSVTILLSLIFVCNCVHTMGLTEQQKNGSAQLFIQNFPHMTFAKAKTTFNTLQKPIQSIVYKKLEKHDERNENKLLSTAFGIALLPQEHQSLILAKTTTPPQTLLKKLNEETILELFTRKAEVDQQCGNKNYLKIMFNAIDSPEHGMYDNPKIEIHLTKQELFGITNDHIEVIKKVQSNILTKKELSLLNDLSPDLLNKLKPHYNFDKDGRILWWSGFNHSINNKNREIKFYYREGRLTKKQKFEFIAKDAFNACKTILPYIIPSLLYIHFIIGPTLNSLTRTQDPNLLRQNIEFEATNKLIDSLKESNIDGSKHLSKCIIKPVPFFYSVDSVPKIYCTLILPTSSILSLAYSPSSLPNDKFFKIKRFLYYLGTFCYSCAALIVSFVIVDYLEINLNYIGNLSQFIFSAGIPTTLALISGFVGLSGIIKGRIDSYKWKQHSIDFTKGESIAQFLNDSSIEIKENINE
jgi:hypothetical protein